MNTNVFHGIAIAGWFINIAGSFMVQRCEGAYFMKGLGIGIVLLSYLSIIIINRKKKNEAASR